MCVRVCVRERGWGRWRRGGERALKLRACSELWPNGLDPHADLAKAAPNVLSFRRSRFKTSFRDCTETAATEHSLETVELGSGTNDEDRLGQRARRCLAQSC